MTLTTTQAFAKFLTDITTTEDQKSNFIPSRKNSVDISMTEAFPSSSDLPFSRGILMGSASKNTIIRPLDDIDVLAEFSNKNNILQNKYWNNSQAFIYRIRQAYAGIKTQQVGTRGQAIRVFYQTGGHVDVAPVFRQRENIFLLPDGAGGWISTAPTIAGTWFATRNKELSYHLSPLVRLAKAWNKAHSKRFRSYHLETIVAVCFSSLGSNYRVALQKFFEFAPRWLSVSDPGGQGGQLSNYLTFTKHQELIVSLDTANIRAKRAIYAESQGNHEEAKRLWRIILGINFPG
jgi:hypothetical protein